MFFLDNDSNLQLHEFFIRNLAIIMILFFVVIVAFYFCFDWYFKKYLPDDKRITKNYAFNIYTSFVLMIAVLFLSFISFIVSYRVLIKGFIENFLPGILFILSVIIAITTPFFFRNKLKEVKQKSKTNKPNYSKFC